MKIRNYFTSIMFLSLLILGNSAQAAFIGGADITPSTSLQAVSTWSVDKIADGITSDISPFNGFVSNSTSGTIKLDLVGTFDLTSFVLWNDVNVYHEGIAGFRLDFFDTANSLITSSATLYGPNGQVAPQTYNFALISGVSSVDLVVLNCNQGFYNRIEIREVAFDGYPSVPEPSSVLLLSSGLVGLAAIQRRARKVTLT